MSFFKFESSKLFPINLLTEKKVFSGLVTACLFAGSPTNFSPDSVNATIEGVVLTPSTFSNTFGCAPSIMATHEFVVPKSIPIIFDIKFYFLINLLTLCGA